MSSSILSKPNSRFSCTFDGRCVPDPDGTYSSEEECLLNCKASDSKDTDLIVYQYNPELAVNLSPKDRVLVLKLLTGLTIPDSADGTTSVRILLALSGFDLDTMCREPLLYPYLSDPSRSHYSEDGFRELYIESLSLLPCLGALLELDRLGHFEHYLRDPSAMNTRYDQETEFQLEDERYESALDDPAYRLHDLLSVNLYKVDVEIFRFLEERGHTKLTECIMLELSVPPLGRFGGHPSPETLSVIDHITDGDNRFSQMAITALFERSSSLFREDLWSYEPIREAMIRKHPVIRSRIAEICLDATEELRKRLTVTISIRPCDVNLYTSKYIEREYKTLRLLAELGSPQDSEWCDFNLLLFQSIGPIPFIELCISGTLTGVERLERILELRGLFSYNGVSSDAHRTLLARLAREAFASQPDYLPSYELFAIFSSFNICVLNDHISDELLVQYITKMDKWCAVHQRYIRSLPPKRRLLFKRALVPLGLF